MKLRYRAVSGEETTRVVWPVVVGYAEATSILIAWCELRQDFRHFRLDRMSEVQVLTVSIGLRTETLRRLWGDWREKQLITNTQRGFPNA